MGRFEISCHTLRRNPPAAKAADDAVAVWIFLTIDAGCILPEVCKEAGVDAGQCRRFRNVILPLWALLPSLFNGEGDDDEKSRGRSQRRRFS